MSHPFVETKEMTVGYRGVPLIRDIALRVHRGEILTLIGPNGSGKSTILKSLIRQLALIGGTVYLDGKSLQTLPERDLARTMSVLLTEHVRPELMTCRPLSVHRTAGSAQRRGPRQGGRGAGACRRG